MEFKIGRAVNAQSITATNAQITMALSYCTSAKRASEIIAQRVRRWFSAALVTTTCVWIVHLTLLVRIPLVVMS